jgi:hypothetical protein
MKGKNLYYVKGEIVKSKSERIADWLYRHNIKYVYEKVSNFKDFNFKPDFPQNQSLSRARYRQEL